MNDQRLAIVVSPATKEDLRGQQGTLDGDAMRERLGLPDAAFKVVSLDAEQDIAEQLDALFDERGDGDCSVLFYASTRISAAEDELFLCLDPNDPDTGDALHDVVEVLRDRIEGPILLVLEAWHQASDDPLFSAELVDLARRAVRSGGSDVEMLIAARPEATEEAQAPSPFTRAVLEILDESDPAHGLNAVEVYDALSDGRLLGVVRALAHLPVEDSFMVVPAREVEIEVPEEEPHEAAPLEATPAPTAAAEAEADEPAASPEPPRAAAIAPPPPEDASDAGAADALASSEAGPRVEEPAPRPPPPSPPPPSQPPPSRPPLSRPPPSEAPAPPRSFPPTSQSDVDAVLDEARRLLHVPDYEGALAAYRRALGLGSLDREARGHVYLKMGTVKALQGKVAEAIANLEKALTMVEGAQTAKVLGELLTLYLEEKDHRAAAATQERILKALPDDQARFTALLKYGRGWLAMPEERMRARQMLERAERIDPENLDLLAMLRDLGQAEGRTEDVLALRRRIADGTRVPGDKAVLLLELGADLHKRGREDEALKLLEAALDEEPQKLEPLALIAEILSERQEWSELESSYRRMLTRLPRLEPEGIRLEVAWELNRRLGLVLRDHLDDASLALEAFEHAARAKPSDANVHKMAVDMARQVDDVDATKRHLLALSEIEPREPRVFRLLFESYMRQNEVERASDAASVLVARGIALDRERAVYEANKPEGTPKFTAVMSEDTWDLLEHRDPELEAVRAIFHATGAAASAALAEVIKRTQAKRLPEDRFKVDPETTTVSAVRSLAWASKTLGLAPPVMYLDDKSNSSFAPILADPPATRIGGGALRGRSVPELAFLAGRLVTYQAPRHRLLALCPAIEDLTACFLAAVSLATGEVTGPESMRRVVGDLAPKVQAWLGTEELEELKKAVHAFSEAGGRADLTRYVASVERTSLRAGVLLAGSLHVGIELAKEGVFEGGYRDALTEAERVDELVSFQVSDAYADVRALLTDDDA